VRGQIIRVVSELEGCDKPRRTEAFATSLAKWPQVAKLYEWENEEDRPAIADDLPSQLCSVAGGSRFALLVKLITYAVAELLHLIANRAAGLLATGRRQQHTNPYADPDSD
jgi:hypothetical protein